jgi:hypothetical protein
VAGVSRVPDVGPDLRLRGPSGWAVVLCYVGCNVFLVATTRAGTNLLWPHVVALVLFAAAAAAAALLPDRRLTRPVTATLAVVPAVLAVLVSWELPPEGLTGYAAWHFGAGTFVLFFLATRAHPVSAWCGMAGVLAATLARVGTTDRDWHALPDLLLTHLSLLLIGTVSGVVLRRATRQAAAVAARTEARWTAQAARLAEAAERNRRVAELERTVRPALERLAAGQVAGPEERRRLAALEAELRDRIRGAALDVPAVVAAVRAARLRGVVVEIMDDGGLAAVPDAAAVLAPIPGMLAAAREGRVVIRILPPGRPAVVTVVAETAGGTSRSTIDRTGTAHHADGNGSAGVEHHVLTGQRQPETAVARRDVDEGQPER